MIQSLTCGIVVYDEIQEIKRLVPKLIVELEDYKVEWIFVLNHEQPEIRKWISEWLNAQISNCICFENPSNNLGFARQLVLEKASSKYIYLTDPDIDLISGNLKKLIQMANAEILYDNRHKFAGFGGTVTHKSENYLLQSTFDLMSKISKLLPFAFQIQNHQHLMAVDHLPACHILLDSEIAKEIGGFSSALNRCGEDLDFTHRAYNFNYRFIFLPSAQVIHWQNLTLGKWLLKMFTLGKIQIPVQKINFNSGLRFYRLLPLCTLIIFITLFFYQYVFLLYFVAALLLLSCFNVGVSGFFLTFLFYSMGELVELVFPIFERRSEAELQAINKRLQNQFYESKINNS